METPTLTLIAGPPGCGKSTLGKAIARRLNACIIDLDTVSSEFIQPHLEVDPSFKDTSEYQTAFRAREYAATLQIAAENIANGASCVCVAPFRKEVQDSAFRNRLQALIRGSCRIVGITIVIDPCDLYDNLSRRKLPRDQRKLERFDEFVTVAIEPYLTPQWNLDCIIKVKFTRGEEWTDKIVGHVVRSLGDAAAEDSVSHSNDCQTLH